MNNEINGSSIYFLVLVMGVVLVFCDVVPAIEGFVTVVGQVVGVLIDVITNKVG